MELLALRKAVVDSTILRLLHGASNISGYRQGVDAMPCLLPSKVDATGALTGLEETVGQSKSYSCTRRIRSNIVL